MAHRGLNTRFQIEVNTGRAAGEQTMDHPLIAASAQTDTVVIGLISCCAQQHNRVACLTPGQTTHLVDIGNHADHAHHWSGMNRGKGAVVAAGLVVEGNVATRHRGIESSASLRKTTTSLRQLPVTAIRFG